MEDDEIQEIEKLKDLQRYQFVFVKCLLKQVGLVIPAFMIGRAYEASEAAMWPNLIWLAIIVLSSAGILYTVISYYKYKPR